MIAGWHHAVDQLLYTSPAHIMDSQLHPTGVTCRKAQGGSRVERVGVILQPADLGPGDLVCDPCAGGGTTLLAAVLEGRRAIGAELDCATFEKAVKRLRSHAITPPLFHDEPRRMAQTGLELGDGET